jgi:arylsulfatase
LINIGNEGVFYTNALAINSATVKSIPGILSSSQTYNPDENLATVFRKKGYTTAAFHSSPLVSQNFSDGFDVFKDLHSQKGLHDRNIRKLARKYLPQGVFNTVKGTYRKIMDESKYLPYMRATEVLKEVSDWIKIVKQPYFVWIHLMEPHLPYFPINSGGLSEEEMIKLNDKLVEAGHRRYNLSQDEITILKELYRQDIFEMDSAIGAFYPKIKEDILLITSDHGDEFGEYGDFSHHEDKFIPPLIHVPFIFCGGKERGTRKGDISHLDVSRILFESTEIDNKIGVWKGFSS